MPATLDISLGPQLTADQAEEIYKRGKEAVVFALVEMAKKLAEQQSSPSPSTPSGMIAPPSKALAPRPPKEKAWAPEGSSGRQTRYSPVQRRPLPRGDGV